jgi:DNA-binding NarL/FixJ family response regulator
MYTPAGASLPSHPSCGFWVVKTMAFDFQNGDVVFTERELFMLSATRSGTKVTEIARQLGITTRTVSLIKESLRDKLGVKSNPELVPQAMKNGLIQ